MKTRTEAACLQSALDELRDAKAAMERAHLQLVWGKDNLARATLSAAIAKTKEIGA